MSSDEWTTDDGLNYYPLPEQKFNTSYVFDEEGLSMYADGMDNPVGSITWREEASAGGDTYVPSNMRLEVGSDREIVLGFKGDPEVDSFRFTKLNGYPEIIAENTEVFVDTISTKSIDFIGSDGQKTGANITSTDEGELVIVFLHNGERRNLNLGGFLMEIMGILK